MASVNYLFLQESMWKCNSKQET